MGVRRVLLWAAVAGSGLAQQDPMQRLIEARHKVADRMSQIPRYMCTETVERTTLGRDPFYGKGKAESCATLLGAGEKHKAKMQILTRDRLRLDVAIIGNSETYSWVGEERFEDKPLNELVRLGSTSTGSFGSFLQAIFMSDSATFAYKGETEWQGRHGLEYTFAVPLWRSSYVVANQTVNRLTAYVGGFTVDAQTLDLLRLEIHADSLAPELQMCDLTTRLDYTQLRINNLEFLLPSEADTQVIDMDGRESLNRTVFSGCHEFLGESRLIFDDSSGSAPLSSERAPTLEIPAGLTVSIALAQSVDPAKDAAGDVVKGVLKQSVKLPGSEVTIAKGTAFNGRICELLEIYGEETSLEFGIKWESLEWGGVKRPVELSVRSVVRGTAKAGDVKANAYPRARAAAGEENRIGYFLISGVGKKYRIPSGFESEWATLPVAAASK